MTNLAQSAGEPYAYLGGKNQVSRATVNGVPFATARFSVPNGDRGTAATIAHMTALVNGPEGVLSPIVRAKALELAQGAVKNVNEIEAVYGWVKKNIQFRGEAGEMLQSPVATLQLGGGDCDDHSTLLGALLQSLGYRVQFKVITTQENSDFSHVYALVKDKRNGQWVPLDTTVANAFPGWEPPNIQRQKMYLVNPPKRRHRGPLGYSGSDLVTPNINYGLVEAPGAPSGLSPTDQAIYNLVAPFSQAGASLLAHGQTINPNISSNLGLSIFGGGGIPTWLVLLAVGSLAFVALRR